jgi:hypothetical protein
MSLVYCIYCTQTLYLWIYLGKQFVVFIVNKISSELNCTACHSCHKVWKMSFMVITKHMCSSARTQTGFLQFILWLIEIEWLIIYSFTSHSRLFHLYGDVTITGEGLQNLGLCSALREFEQGGISIVPQLLRHETSVFPVSSERPPHSVASYDKRGDVEGLF